MEYIDYQCNRFWWCISTDVEDVYTYNVIYPCTVGMSKWPMGYDTSLMYQGTEILIFTKARYFLSCRRSCFVYSLSKVLFSLFTVRSPFLSVHCQWSWLVYSLWKVMSCLFIVIGPFLSIYSHRSCHVYSLFKGLSCLFTVGLVMSIHCQRSCLVYSLLKVLSCLFTVKGPVLSIHH